MNPDPYEIAERLGRQKAASRFHDINFDFTEGNYDCVDFWATGDTLYVGEIKNYIRERNLREYSDYMIDWSKIVNLLAVAKKEERTPLLICFFWDWTIIWDLSKIGEIEIDKRRKWKKVNKDGLHYGEKENSIMTFLYENEAVWKEKAEETKRRMKS